MISMDGVLKERLSETDKQRTLRERLSVSDMKE